jgi:hypothetical protein
MQALTCRSGFSCTIDRQRQKEAMTDTARIYQRVGVALVGALALAGCEFAPVWTAAGTRMSETAALESFSAAQEKLPPRAEGDTRIFIFRPQAVVGMLGAPVVIVDGTWMGDPQDPANNRMLPGSVFVVDTPAAVTRVWWYQAGRGEEKDMALELPSAESRAWYLRWSMKPTSGYLQRVAEADALREIAPLKFGGYVRVDAH